MLYRAKQSLILGAIFILVFVVHVQSRVITSYDSAWSIPLAMSVLKERNTNLDEYTRVEHSYHFVSADENLYYLFPVGAPLLAIPVLRVLDSLSLPLFSVEDLYAYLRVDPVGMTANQIEGLVASLVIALASVFIYLIARRYLTVRRSLILTFLFAFGTSAWSTGGRGLWQHGPSMLMLAIALYFIVLAQEKPYYIQFASLPLAYAYVVRPTNSISIVVFSLYVLIRYHRYFLHYSAWAMVIAVPFILYNWSIYGHILAPYYLPNRIGDGKFFYEALAGNLISPARGLFVFTPIALFSLVGAFLGFRRRWSRRAYCSVSGYHHRAPLGRVSSFPHWYGGYSIGPRFMSDMTPYFIFLLIPILDYLTLPLTPLKATFAVGFAVLSLISILIAGWTANSQAVPQWNESPVSVDIATERVWDWRDLQFLRGSGIRAAHLDAAPNSLAVVGSPETEAAERQKVSLSIVNSGGRALDWHIKMPPRVSLDSTNTEASSSTRLDGDFDKYDLELFVDMTNYSEPDKYSAGAILLWATTPKGLPALGGPIAIPVTIDLSSQAEPVNPATKTDVPRRSQEVQMAGHHLFLPLVTYHRPSTNSSHQVPVKQDPALPDDLMLNGQTQISSVSDVWSVHGIGWYDGESSEGYAWRWAASPAEIYIYSDSPRIVQIRSTPIALHVSEASDGLGTHGTMLVSVNEEETSAIQVEVGSPFAVDAALAQGWTVVRFILDADNFVPDQITGNGDRRELSFALAPIDILTDY